MARVVRVLTCVAASLGWVACAAQRTPGKLPSVKAATSGMQAQKSKDTYAGEPTVTEHLDTVYRYNADGTGSKTDTAVVRVQSDAAVRGLRVLPVPYSAGTKRIEFVSVRVHKANGATVETPGAEAQDQATPAAQAAPTYNDLHVALLPVRGLAVGDRLEFQIRTVFTRAEVPDQFWGVESFGHGRVILERDVELHVPAGKYVQVASPRYPAKVTQEAGETVYRWSGAQTRPTVHPTSAADATEPDENDDTSPAIAWTTFHSWAEVGTWYRGLTANSVAVTPSVKAKADSIVYGLGSQDARLKALSNFVARDVRSINVPLGSGPWQPHSAEQVLDQQYGDTRDKTVLLCAMLRAEKLPCSLALVGADRQVDAAVPEPGWFTHVLVLSGVSGQPEVWLDPMPELAPFGALDASLRDKLALVIPPSGDAVLRPTPADAPFAASSSFEASASLDTEGVLKAHVNVVMRGDDEVQFRQALRNAGPAQLDRVSQALVDRAALKGTVTGTTADLPEAVDTPLHLGFDLTQPNYGDWENFRILPLEPGLTLPLSSRKSAPAHDVELGGRRTEVATSRITLPVGFSADLPPAVHLHTAFADLDKTYKLETGGTAPALVTERRFTVKQNKVPAADWPAYRKFLDDVGESEPWVQLTSGGTLGGHHAPNAGENNPKAAELVAQADAALQAKDLATAKTKLDQAQAISPRQPFLWAGYGELAERDGKASEAADAYRHELQSHPDEGSVSHRLAIVLGRQGKTAEAIDVLTAAMALNPGDAKTATMLGTLQAKGDPAAAEKTLRAGLAAAPDSLQLKLALGRLLLLRGNRAEAGTLLTAVATDSQDPGELNDVAYAMGDAGLNLPVAEAASRRVIRMLNDASARAVGSRDSEAQLLRSLQLIASWDTYGWVLFKEGNTSEAELWLKAAWADGYGAEPGRHLAQLLAREGNAAEAARVQHLAAGGEHIESTGSLEEAAGVHARHQRAGEADPRASQKAARTFTVPRAPNTPAGTAIFDLEYSLNAEPAAHFVRGDQGLLNMEAALGRVDTHTLIPAGSPAHLLRRGVVHCGPSGPCSLEILPAGAALSD